MKSGMNAEGTSEETRNVRVIIKGRVQGVWYRAWTTKQARARGLAGWVRNRADGAVEALFSGPRAQVDEMLAALRGGPPLARVTDVEIHSGEAPGEPGFNPLSRP